jgi:hypothetical protein
VLRDNADTPWTPPGGGLTGALCHDVIHGLDITWPLRLTYQISAQAATTVLDSLIGSGARTLFGFPLEGIKVTATDLEWSAGSGEELSGLSRDLLPLLAGRVVPHELFGGAGAVLAWSQQGR